MAVRLVIVCAAACALAAGLLSTLGERDFRARSFVVRVPPEAGSARGLDMVRSDRVLRRALAIARRGDVDPAWLRDHSHAELTSRLDIALTVETPDRERSAELATAYAKAVRRSVGRVPGLATRGRGARDAEAELGPLGWTLIGGAAGLWIGTALAIVISARRGSARAPRPASAPCAPATRATRG